MNIQKSFCTFLLVSLLVFSSSLWAAVTYTVKTTGDANLACTMTGPGAFDCPTLRSAISTANANPGTDNILFNISGAGCVAGVCTIYPSSLLNVTEAVTIDGYTQPGAIPRMVGVTPGVQNEIPAQLKVVLDGSCSTQDGLRLFRTDGSVVKGLLITKFPPNTPTPVPAPTTPCNTANTNNTGLLVTDGMNNVIVGNYIGPGDVTGMTLSNAMFRAVGIVSSNVVGLAPNNNRVGGPNASDRNVISGVGRGVLGRGVNIISNIADGTVADGNQIIGNLIGVAADGVTPLANRSFGILTNFPKNLLIEGNFVNNNALGAQLQGGNQLGFPFTVGLKVKNNTFNDNRSRGIAVIIGFDGAEIQNNIIRNNPFDGIFLGEVNFSLLENNIVGGNKFGITLGQDTMNNTLKHNWVGTDSTGVDLGNTADGIHLAVTTSLDANGNPVPSDSGLDGPTQNLITENIVAFNHGAGILVSSDHDGNLSNPGDAFNNSILHNSIYSNMGLGIDLTSAFQTINLNGALLRYGAPDGPTLNDPLDPDVGANNYQNFPVLNSENSFINPEKAKVKGSLDSKPNQEYLIEIFANLEGDPSNYGAGRIFIGKTTVTTNNAGHADFAFMADEHFPVVKASDGVCKAAPILTATATDKLTGDTSEFSRWVEVETKGSASAYAQHCNDE